MLGYNKSCEKDENYWRNKNLFTFRGDKYHNVLTGYARRPLDLGGEIPCKAKELLM